jgi:hypothetical protein
LEVIFGLGSRLEELGFGDLDWFFGEGFGRE